MLEAVIYDMDGVLVDSEPLWREAMVAAFAEVGVSVTTAQCAETTGLRIDQVVAYRYEQTPWQGKSQSETVDLILQKLVKLIHAKAVPMAGAIRSIHFFKKRNFRIGLATSSSTVIIDAVLDTLQIRDLFEVVSSAEKLAYGKPHPEVYITTAKQLGVDPTACIAIEDSFNGLLSAKSARMKTIVVPEVVNRKQAQFVIADLQLDSLNELEEKHLALL